jgi:hypothetical protein
MTMMMIVLHLMMTLYSMMNTKKRNRQIMLWKKRRAPLATTIPTHKKNIFKHQYNNIIQTSVITMNLRQW